MLFVEFLVLLCLVDLFAFTLFLVGGEREVDCLVVLEDPLFRRVVGPEKAVLSLALDTSALSLSLTS
jgi:hypothetical protein